MGETTYCVQQEARLAQQAETLPQGQISENFSPMIIGLNASIFTPGQPALPSLAILKRSQAPLPLKQLKSRDQVSYKTGFSC